MNLKTISLRLAMILAAVSLLVLSLPVPVMAASFNLTPTSGPPGTVVNVIGSGYVNGESYQIIFAPGTSYQTYLPSASPISVNGTTFSTPVTIPNAPFGLYTIRVSATTSGNLEQNFNLTAKVSLNNSSGNVGDTVLVSGSGFRSSVPVFIFFNNNQVVSSSTDIYGTMTPVSFTIPAIKAATYFVYGTDGEAVSSSAGFTVRQLLRTDNSQAMVGDTLEISGTGFEYNSGITFFWDNTQVDTPQPVYTDSTGRFLTNFTVPTSTRGTHTLKARDNSLGFASVTIEILSSLEVDPTRSSPGHTVSLIGNGFRASMSVDVLFSGEEIVTQPTTITTSTTGSFLASFVVPDVAAASYIVKASDGSYSATATLMVSSTITLNPTSGNVGTEVTVTGTGFTPSSSIALSYDSQTLKTLNAGSDGNFSTTFNAPASAGGPHTVSAQQAGVTIAATATFTMESTPPAAPAPVSPANDTQTDVQPTFSWSAVTDPSGVTYDLQIARDAAFAPPVFSKTGIAQNSYLLGTSEKLDLVKQASPYYWRVRAVDGASNASDWTSALSFYTQDSTAPDTPSAFTPAEGTQTEVQTSFTWSLVTDPSGVTYDLEIARDALFSQLVFSKTGVSQNAYQLSAAEKLDPVKKASPYYWRVRAVDGVANASAWTSALSFYTQDSTAPDVPVLQRPANGARAGSMPTFDWSDVTDPSGVSYSLQVAMDTNFNQLLLSKDGLSQSEYKLTNAEKLTNSTGNPPSPYFWRVRATDGAQNQSAWTNANAFYVGGVFQGALLYAVLGLAGLLLLVIGIFIGMRIRPTAKPKGTPPAA